MSRPQKETTVRPRRTNPNVTRRARFSYPPPDEGHEYAWVKHRSCSFLVRHREYQYRSERGSYRYPEAFHYSEHKLTTDAIDAARRLKAEALPGDRIIAMVAGGHVLWEWLQIGSEYNDGYILATPRFRRTDLTKCDPAYTLLLP